MSKKVPNTRHEEGRAQVDASVRAALISTPIQRGVLASKLGWPPAIVSASLKRLVEAGKAARVESNNPKCPSYKRAGRA